MKAILKSNRKVIVDVELWAEFPSGKVYKDKNGNMTYFEDELDFIEYYGG